MSNAYIRLLRPKQWSKNLLVFAALLFTNGLSHPTPALLALIAFTATCFISSGAYIFNDLQDVEKDRAHPSKRHRPLAAGQVRPAAAIAIAAILLAVGLVMLFYLGKKAVAIILVYLLLQVIYNFGAKAIPVLDVFLIGSGFVLRAVLGAAAINVKISAWLLLCTGSLALLLGFAKRRHEFILQGDKRHTSRQSLAGYSRQSLDGLVLMAATAAALCYSIYALQSPTAQQHPALFLTAIPVFYGICRYVLIVFVRDEGGEPENILFKDPHILASVILFVLSAVYALSVKTLPLIEITRSGG